MIGFGASKSVIGSAKVSIQKSIESIFDYVGKRFFDNYQKWAPEIVELQPLSTGPIAVGSRGRQLRIDQGQCTESTFEVEDFIPCQRISIKGETDPYRCIYSFDASQSDHGAQTQMSFSYELLELELFMRPFEKLIRIAIQEGAECTVNNIKQLVEA